MTTNPPTARPTTTTRTTRALLVLVALAAMALAACGAAGGPTQSPGATPTPVPTPTPITGPVTTPEEAAAAVIAADSRFSGIRRLDPNVIGASAWWTAETVGDGYEVTIVVGWGDCPAGCIDRHTWRFGVSADGTVALLEESGSPLPSGALPG